MVFDNLGEYLNFLRERNDLVEVNDPVDTDLELTWILSEEQRIGKRRSMIFKNVNGYDIPVAGNLFASDEKIEYILGDKPFNIGTKLKNLVRIPDNTESMISRGLEMLKELSGLKPHIGSRKDSEFNVLEKVDLNRYPICKTWPDDGGKFITMPMVITKDPETGQRNVGTYRMQVYDSETTGMHWHIHKGGAEQMSKYKKPMDVAVVIGSDPLTFFSSVAPLPNGIDEFSFRGLLARKRMDLIKGETVDLEYPRNSEIVLEGYVDPSETRLEGPFGDHTGYYSLQEQFPVFHIKKIIEKKNPIYTTTIVGKLWHEDVRIGKAIERLFLPLIQIQIPEIVDLNTMEEGVFHEMIVVSIKKRYPGHAKKVMFSIWGTGQLMLSKIVVIVDDDINIHDRSQVLWAIATRVDPASDVLIIPGTLTDSLDHTARTFNYGSKMGIDATKKLKGENYNRTWPDVLSMTGDIEKKADDIISKLTGKN
ncbi:menaquinone biosynthesis decarboxylase [Picrophilus oshimae]|uniref:Anhydromevalonate phosphate decarboxylase n=1 Tax=Picrophilus torridus (strain ATCC 700027 / DSM 9790 / JCM 10055 / NBRC 100828 / KAW 2/3) TaxID=1122961 RepID=Q6L2Q2_PICTO|nr:menaquinone biosynthesis decarboxylase [Picrophilus oshimae]AAT42750.1 3-octaprenyl-4-hydroxybenzoate carboxy-lyase [Picrophilus oshimae DSM 9789]SMD31538.1 3-octaprenyl-4hydroxybenzoate decarboxylase [Picrophilus oshimae DSM 9789]